jgi:hypothetical protein
MTYPIRQPPDGDTAWGGDLRNTVAAANDHQTRVTALEASQATQDTRLDALDGVSNIGNVGSTIAVTPGINNGTVKRITLTSATCTITFNAPAADGRVKVLEFVITQDGTGGRVITWPAGIKWAGGAGAPTLTATAGAVDRIVFVTYNDGTTWYGDLIGKAYA